jgi:uncharacterized membrane protein
MQRRLVGITGWIGLFVHDSIVTQNTRIVPLVFTDKSGLQYELFMRRAKKLNQSGFIPMIIILVLVLLAVVVFAYLRVARR